MAHDSTSGNLPVRISSTLRNKNETFISLLKHANEWNPLKYFL